jgi:4-phytase/acid phosphatase
VPKTHSLWLLPFALCCASFLTAQPVDDTQLKQVIIFGRHNVRSPVDSNSTLDTYSVREFPDFEIPPGILTANGAELETILGGYYRLWLTKEGLLTGNDSADAASVYFRANVEERTIVTAQALAAGMFPADNINVDHYGPTASDPLFEPVGAGVALLNPQKASAAVKGRLGGNAQSLSSAYAPELALTRSVLFDYPVSQTPALTTPEGKVDVTTIPFVITTPGPSTWAVNPGGLTQVFDAVDPFIMEYTNGLAPSDVAWGQLTRDGISQTSRLDSLVLNLLYRTPYLERVQSSNLASHIVRSLMQAETGTAMTGSLGTPSTKLIVLIASDSQIIGLAGLFHLDWLLPGYQQDFCGPGGALVLELRQSRSTQQYIVRASYIAQTMDQLRNQTPLTLDAPPAIAPVFIPNCSVANATFDCALADFVGIANQVIDPESADLVN